MAATSSAVASAAFECSCEHVRQVSRLLVDVQRARDRPSLLAAWRRRIGLEREWESALYDVASDFHEQLDVEGAILYARWAPPPEEPHDGVLVGDSSSVAKGLIDVWKRLYRPSKADLGEFESWTGPRRAAAEQALRAAEVEGYEARVLRDATGRAVAIAAVRESEGALEVYRLAASGGGYGTKMMSELAGSAARRSLTVRLSPSSAARAYFDKLGLTKQGADYTLTSVQAKELATSEGYTSPSVEDMKKRLLVGVSQPTTEAAVGGMSTSEFVLLNAAQVYLQMAMSTSTLAGQTALEHMGINKTWAWAHPQNMARDMFAVRGSKVIQAMYGDHLTRLQQIISEATDPRRPLTIQQVSAKIKTEWPALQRWKVEQIARTETAAVWTATSMNAYAANGITSWESTLAHGPAIGIDQSAPCDLCVEAALDFYAMGGGDYPPWHPSCRCEAVPVLETPEGDPWLPPGDPFTGGAKDAKELPVRGTPEAREAERFLSPAPPPPGGSNLAALSPTVRSEVEKALAEIKSDLPLPVRDVMVSADESKFTGIFEGARARYDPTTRAIYLRPSAWNDTKTIREYWQHYTRGAGKGWWSRGSEKRSFTEWTLTHEYAHAVDDSALLVLGLPRGAPGYFGGTWMDDGIKRFRDVVGGYGRGTEGETFAEAYTMWRYGTLSADDAAYLESNMARVFRERAAPAPAPVRIAGDLEGLSLAELKQQYASAGNRISGLKTQIKRESALPRPDALKLEQFQARLQQEQDFRLKVKERIAEKPAEPPARPPGEQPNLDTWLSKESQDAWGKDTLRVTDLDLDATRAHLRDLDLVPTELVRRLQAAKGGVRGVYVGKGGVPELDEMGYLSGVRPRGWAEGDTWDIVGGAYAEGDRYILAGTGRSGSYSTILHETGHAVQSRLFNTTMVNELRRYQKLFHKELRKYYQQGGPGGAAGASEMWAETFALRIKGGEKKVYEFLGGENATSRSYVQWMNERLGLVEKPLPPSAAVASESESGIRSLFAKDEREEAYKQAGITALYDLESRGLLANARRVEVVGSMVSGNVVSKDIDLLITVDKATAAQEENMRKFFWTAKHEYKDVHVIFAQETKTGLKAITIDGVKSNLVFSPEDAARVRAITLKRYDVSPKVVWESEKVLPELPPAALRAPQWKLKDPSKPNTVFFHNSPGEARASITEHGLLPGGGGKGTPHPGQDFETDFPAIYMHPEDSLKWALDEAEQAGGYTTYRITIPKSHYESIKMDQELTPAFIKKISPEWIEMYVEGKWVPLKSLKPPKIEPRAADLVLPKEPADLRFPSGRTSVEAFEREIARYEGLTVRVTHELPGNAESVGFGKLTQEGGKWFVDGRAVGNGVGVKKIEVLSGKEYVTVAERKAPGVVVGPSIVELKAKLVSAGNRLSGLKTQLKRELGRPVVDYRKITDIRVRISDEESLRTSLRAEIAEAKRAPGGEAEVRVPRVERPKELPPGLLRDVEELRAQTPLEIGITGIATTKQMDTVIAIGERVEKEMRVVLDRVTADVQLGIRQAETKVAEREFLMKGVVEVKERAGGRYADLRDVELDRLTMQRYGKPFSDLEALATNDRPYTWVERDALFKEADSVPRVAEAKSAWAASETEHKQALHDLGVVRKELEAAQQEMVVAQRQAYLDTLGQIRAMGHTADTRLRYTEKTWGGTAKKTSVSKTRKVLDAAQDYLPTDWISRMRPADVGWAKRGHHMSLGDAQEILVSGGREGKALYSDPDGISTALHELGHEVEATSKLILEQEAAFYRHRTTDYETGVQEATEGLRKLTGIRYGKEEIARPDRFANAYMGRWYPGGKAYELLSMGLEGIFMGKFSAMDIEMRRWVLGLLAVA